MNMSNPVILCVDDEEVILNGLESELRQFLGDEYQLECFQSAEEMFEYLEELHSEQKEVVLVITDYVMPGMKGDELLINLHQKLPKVRKIMLTGHACLEAVTQAVNKANLDRYIGKPWDRNDFAQAVLGAIKSYYMEKEVENEREELQKIQEIRSQLMAVLQQMPVGVCVFDRNKKINMVNDATPEIMELDGNITDIGEEFTVYSADGVHLSENNTPLIRSLANGEIITGEELHFKNKDGKEYIISVSSSPIRDRGGEIIAGVAIFHDVSQKRQLEQELARVDRLNLVGQMAASIGHEIRNPMTTVRGYLQHLRGKTVFAKYREQFALMVDELDRANSIITEFLLLARNRAVSLVAGNLNAVINNVFPLLAAEGLERQKNIRKSLQTIPDILMDDGNIRQVIHNLVRNGIDAGNNVEIRTYREEDKIILAVQDDGPGIPQAVLGKLGLPFVTTKENGTGLGLAVCYNIAEEHNAAIRVKSTPRGTTFYISFPLAE